jgi:hypothetical protein
VLGLDRRGTQIVEKRDGRARVHDFKIFQDLFNAVPVPEKARLALFVRFEYDSPFSFHSIQ